MIDTQEKTIVNLLNAVREQHDQLNNQKIKIKNLEDKVDACLTKCHNKIKCLWFRHVLFNNIKERGDFFGPFFKRCRLNYTLLQISYDNYQDTADKAKYPDPDISDLFEYLAGNSSLDTNGETISSLLYPLMPSH